MSRAQGTALVTCGVVLTLAIIVGGWIALAKSERVVVATERMETRFQRFADHVEPVAVAGGEKAVEAVRNLDAEKAADKGDELIEAAAEKAKRFLNRDQESPEAN